jgi:hypothetical protein
MGPAGPQGPAGPAGLGWTANGNDLYAALTGNVGLGTQTPTAKLDVAGHILGTPVAARWLQSNTTYAGPGAWVWDVETFNTAPTYLTRIGGNQIIQILKPGYYQVHATVLVGNLAVGQRNDVHMLRNGSPVELSLGGGVSGIGVWTKHHLHYVDSFNAMDTIQVVIPNGSPGERYGWGWATLSVIRLN